MSRTACGVLVLALFATSAAQAAIVSYGSRNAFDAAFAGSVRENWDGFANGTQFADGSSANGITYFSSAGNALVTSFFLPSTFPNGLGDTVEGFFLAEDAITFTFSAPLLAFGIDINTASVIAGAYAATTEDGDVAASVFDPFPGFGTGQFIGFLSDTPFTSVTIVGTPAAQGDAYTLDTLRAVNEQPPNGVPEPGSLALAAAALAGLGAAWGRGGLVRRRRGDQVLAAAITPPPRHTSPS